MRKLTPLEAARLLINEGTLRVDEGGRIWKEQIRASSGARRKITPKRAEQQSKTGYLIVPLRINGQSLLISAHRLVWQIKVGTIPEGMDLNHLNGIKTDNNPKNLELATRSRNLKHCYETGLRRPEKISVRTISEIPRLRASGMPFAAIAKTLGISQTTAFRRSKA